MMLLHVKGIVIVKHLQFYSCYLDPGFRYTLFIQQPTFVKVCSQRQLRYESLATVNFVIYSNENPYLVDFIITNISYS